MRVVDVLDISDFRFAGGTAASIAEEIAAQAGAGWTTGLIHLNGPLVARVTGFNPRITEQLADGSARLLIGHDPVRAAITLIRHPTVLDQASDQLPPITTEQVVVIVNSTMIAPDGAREFDPARINRLVRQRFGLDPLWAPLSSRIRGQLLAAGGDLRLIADDWVNVIDARSWHVEHDAPAGDRPVIGRHSRDVAAKWPRERAELLAAYPEDGSVEVRVLGGARSARAVLGSQLPDSWRVWEFGTREPREFLQGIDTYVYYTDPRWIEAFGRNVLEAMAAGVPVVLPPVFETIFADAALYAEPAGIQEVVRSLHRDTNLWLRISEHARATARRRFSRQVHVDRIQALSGLEARTPQAGGEQSGHSASRLRGTPATRAADERPKLLLVSSNGTGMGHLMRLMAYARRATHFQPHVVSLSQGVAAVGRLGMSYEYVPSAAGLGMDPSSWQPIFTDRIGAVLRRVRPAVVVFDGTWPYNGIEELRSTHPDPLWVWSRRGMWQPGRSRDQLKKAAWFDAVIEPGDFASAGDIGATASAPAVRIPPVTLLDEDELLTRHAARRELGLPTGGRIALVAFSGGAVEDVTSDTAAAIAACRRVGLEICVTQSVVAPDVALPDDVHVINPIPLATYQRAFDVAISAAGYNSFHELLRFGTPTLFIPKRNSALDDQGRRARWAADQGWSLCAPGCRSQEPSRCWPNCSSTATR
ncbi:antifreeze protein, type I [Microlunatus endophyticus]